jgi:hypothetical protein
VELARHGRDRGWWIPTLGGHRDAPGAETACPGDNVYDLLPALRNEVSRPVPVPPKKRFMKMYMVRNMDKGSVLMVTGGASLLIVGTDDLKRHTAAGIPTIDCSPDQFKRYEAIRKA